MVAKAENSKDSNMLFCLLERANSTIYEVSAAGDPEAEAKPKGAETL